MFVSCVPIVPRLHGCVSTDSLCNEKLQPSLCKWEVPTGDFLSMKQTQSFEAHKLLLWKKRKKNG